MIRFLSLMVVSEHGRLEKVSYAVGYVVRVAGKEQHAYVADLPKGSPESEVVDRFVEVRALKYSGSLEFLPNRVNDSEVDSDYFAKDRAFIYEAEYPELFRDACAAASVLLAVKDFFPRYQKNQLVSPDPFGFIKHGETVRLYSAGTILLKTFVCESAGLCILSDPSAPNIEAPRICVFRMCETDRLVESIKEDIHTLHKLISSLEEKNNVQ